jgi:hypothetical protein
MSRHPRTDDIARGNHVVPVEFAQEMDSELLTMSRLCDPSVLSPKKLLWRLARLKRG